MTSTSSSAPIAQLGLWPSEFGQRPKERSRGAGTPSGLSGCPASAALGLPPHTTGRQPGPEISTVHTRVLSIGAVLKIVTGCTPFPPPAVLLPELIIVKISALPVPHSSWTFYSGLKSTSSVGSITNVQPFRDGAFPHRVMD